jgi:hypothetical protein
MDLGCGVLGRLQKGFAWSRVEGFSVKLMLHDEPLYLAPTHPGSPGRDLYFLSGDVLPKR